MPHLLRQNLLLPAPPTVVMHDPRTHLRHLPPAYSPAQSPLSRDRERDFAPQVRYHLELPRRPKLRPCKVIFVGDCSVGKTAIVNRCVKMSWNFGEDNLLISDSSISSGSVLTSSSQTTRPPLAWILSWRTLTYWVTIIV